MTLLQRMFGVVAVTYLLVTAVSINNHDPRETGVPTLRTIPVEVKQPADVLSLSNDTLDNADPTDGMSTLCEEADQSSRDQSASYDDMQLDSDAEDALAKRISRRLSESSSAEHLYVASLSTRDPAEKAELLKRAIALAPTDSFLIWSAFDSCINSDPSTYCPMASWEQLLIDVDGGNSEAWRRIAAHRFAAGEHEGALDAMRYAATAAESRIYRSETIEAIERALAAASNLSFEARAVWAVGVEAAMAHYGDLIGMCQEMSSGNAEWAHVCLSYGQLLERQGKADLSVGVALQVQKMVLEALGDTDGVEAVGQRIQSYRRIANAAYGEYDPVVAYVVISDPDLFYSYLDIARSKGELVARQRLREEVAALVEEQPSLRCVPQRYRLED